MGSTLENDAGNSPSKGTLSPSAAAEEANITAEGLLVMASRNSIEREQTRQLLSSVALELQQESVTSTRVLEYSLRQVSARSAEESSVARSLNDLRKHIEFIDPSALEFDNGWFRRFFLYFFPKRVPATRFFVRYELTQAALTETLAALEEGREELRRDTVTLAADQHDLDLTIEKLNAALESMDRLRDEITLAREKEGDSERGKVIDEYILFPLGQRTLDLKQQLAVSQQGVLALHLIIKNNQELISSIDRALYATSTGLQIMAAAANALSERKKVDHRMQNVNGLAKIFTELKKTIEAADTHRSTAVLAAASSIGEIGVFTRAKPEREIVDL